MKMISGIICALILTGCATTSQQKKNWEQGGTATAAPANVSHWTAEQYDEVLECVAINRKIVLQECGEAKAATYSSNLTNEIYLLDYEDAINHIINMRKHMIAFHSK
ncbi:hypothetical protein P4E94_15770 [Pontiellaceae bacterium B12219]|nr:hypothetical protein [Pontiellaceae bacterium B12219]